MKNFNLVSFALTVENFIKDETAIDTAHMLLIFSLIISSKPAKSLELGIGKSFATQAILAGIKYNSSGTLTCVDNLIDFHKIEPTFFPELRNRGVNIIAPINEMDFVHNCKEKYDFIMSDADHEKSGTWIKETMLLLNPGGLICFHDIGTIYPNSKLILDAIEQYGYSKILFNLNSLPDERCDRGFLLVKKDKI
jgi:predicted O-methyltransferase YrrM